MTVHPAELGMFYEDFVVGDTYQHPIGRTISEADAVWFALLTCNTNQYHFNAHISKSNQITGGRITCDSALTVAVVLGISAIGTSQNGVANLGWSEIKLGQGLYVGDTIYAESLIVSKRASASHPGMGIVVAITRGQNQDGEELVKWSRGMMIPMRETGINQNYFPQCQSGPLVAP